jgi:hypothetical protein
MPRILRAALVAGLVIGLLSSIPVVQAANYCCGLWLFGGGLLAAYLLQQGQAAPITANDGALVGLQAGLVGFVVSLLLLGAMYWSAGWMAPDYLHNIVDLLDGWRIERPDQEGGRGALFAFRLVLAFIFSLIVPPIGGLLGVALFRSEPAVPAPPPPSAP